MNDERWNGRGVVVDLGRTSAEKNIEQFILQNERARKGNPIQTSISRGYGKDRRGGLALGEGV